MNELSIEQMEMVSGGSVFGCAGALLTSASSILGLAAGAALTTGPAAPVIITGLFLAHFAADIVALDQCGAL